MNKTLKNSLPVIYGCVAFATVSLFASCSDATAKTERNAPATTTAAAPAAKEETKESSAIKVSAKTLTAEYEANEVAADEKYKGNTIEVTGTVTGISKDITDDIYVTLNSGSELDFKEVQCFFEDKTAASKLKKGSKVTFKGNCDGLMMNVIMKECVLVN